MAMYLDPWNHPDAWDEVVFADTLRTPGVATVGKWDRENVYDIKEGKGTAGATVTLKNQPPAKGPITFKVWTRAQMLDFNRILDALRFDPTKTATGSAAAPAAADKPSFTIGETKDGNSGGSSTTTVTEKATKDSSDAADTKSKDPPALGKDSAILIFHPALADIDVHAVFPPEKLGTWERQDDFSFIRTVEFLEFKDASAQSIATTPTGAAPGAAGQDATAGGSEGGAPDGGADAGKGAGKDAQGSWGAP